MDGWDQKLWGFSLKNALLLKKVNIEWIDLLFRVVFWRINL